MTGKRCIDAMLDELRPVEPLDDTARRELDELVKERYTFVGNGCVMDNITLEVIPILAKPPPTPVPGPGRLLYQESPGLYWEEKAAILCAFMTALYTCIHFL